MTQKEYLQVHNLQKEWVKKSVELPNELKEDNRDDGSVNCELDVFVLRILEIEKRLQNLKAVRNIRFVQEWTGYEDCNICINYEQYETEKEFSERVQHQYEEWKESEKIREANAEKKDDEYKKELEKLNLKYGKL